MTDVTAARSYRPGQWFGIFGDHAEVLLPPSEKGRVGTLWALVDDGAGFDVVLDALISEGLRDLPGFVLVATVDGETKVVIRGEARAWFTTGDDTVEVAGTDVTTWAERTFTGVTATRLVVGAGDDADDPAGSGPLPIDNGLVRVSEVASPPAAAAAPEVEQPPLAPVEPTPEVEEPTPEVEVPTLASLAATPEGEVRGAPATSLETPEPEPEPAPAYDPEPAPLPPPPFGVPPVPPPPIEHDGDTRTGLVPEPDPAEVEMPAAVTRPVARLVFSSGENLDVDRAVLVGRAPEARRFTSGDQPQLVTVPSPAQEISSTHLEIRPGSGADHGSAVVTDLGSTNGTVLVQPGLPPEDLQAGMAVQLIPGAILDLGDGVTIQVINP